MEKNNRHPLDDIKPVYDYVEKEIIEKPSVIEKAKKKIKDFFEKDEELPVEIEPKKITPVYDYERESGIPDASKSVVFDSLFGGAFTYMSPRDTANILKKNLPLLKKRFPFKTYKKSIAGFVGEKVQDFYTWEQAINYLNKKDYVDPVRMMTGGGTLFQGRYFKGYFPQWEDLVRLRIHSKILKPLMKQILTMDEKDIVNNNQKIKNMTLYATQLSEKIIRKIPDIKIAKHHGNYFHALVDNADDIIKFSEEKVKEFEGEKGIEKGLTGFSNFSMSFLKEFTKYVPKPVDVYKRIFADTPKARAIKKQSEEVSLESMRQETPTLVWAGSTIGTLVREIALWNAAGAILKGAGFTKFIATSLDKNRAIMRTAIAMGGKPGAVFKKGIQSAINFGARAVLKESFKTGVSLINNGKEEFIKDLKEMPKSIAYMTLLGAHDVLGKAKLVRLGLGALEGAFQSYFSGDKNGFMANVLFSALVNLPLSKSSLKQSVSSKELNRQIKKLTPKIEAKVSGFSDREIAKRFIYPLLDKLTGLSTKKNGISIDKSIKKKLKTLYSFRVNKHLNDGKNLASSKIIANTEIKDIYKNVNKIHGNLESVFIKNEKKAWKDIVKNMKITSKKISKMAKTGIDIDTKDEKVLIALAKKSRGMQAFEERLLKQISKKTLKVSEDKLQYLIGSNPKFAKQLNIESLKLPIKSKQILNVSNYLEDLYHRSKGIRIKLKEPRSAEELQNLLTANPTQKSYIHLPKLSINNFFNMKQYIQKYSNIMAFGDVKQFKVFNDIFTEVGANKYVLDRLTKVIKSFNDSPERKIFFTSVNGADEFIILPKYETGMNITRDVFKKELRVFDVLLEKKLKEFVSTDELVKNYLKNESDGRDGFGTKMINRLKTRERIVKENIFNIAKKYGVENYNPQKNIALFDDNKSFRKDVTSLFQKYSKEINKGVPAIRVDTGFSSNLSYDGADKTVKAVKVIDAVSSFLSKDKKWDFVNKNFNVKKIEYEKYEDLVDVTDTLIGRFYKEVPSEVHGGRFNAKAFIEFAKKDKNTWTLFKDIVENFNKGFNKDIEISSIISKQEQTAQAYADLIRVKTPEDVKAALPNFLRDMIELMPESIKEMKKSGKIIIGQKKGWRNAVGVKIRQKLAEGGRGRPGGVAEAYRSFNETFQNWYNLWISSSTRHTELFNKVFETFFSDLNPAERKHFPVVLELLWKNYRKGEPWKETMVRSLDDAINEGYTKHAQNLKKDLKDIDIEKIIKIQNDMMEINKEFINFTKKSGSPLGINMEVPMRGEAELGAFDKRLVDQIQKIGLLKEFKDIKKTKEALLLKLKNKDMTKVQFTQYMKENKILKTLEQETIVGKLIDDVFLARDAFIQEQKGFTPLLIMRHPIKYLKSNESLIMQPLAEQQKRKISFKLADTFGLYSLKNPAQIYTLRYKNYFTKLEHAQILNTLSKQKASYDLGNKIEDIPLILKNEKGSSGRNAWMEKLNANAEESLNGKKFSEIYEEVPQSVYPELKGRYVVKEFGGVLDDILQSQKPAGLLKSASSWLKTRRLFKFFILWKNDLVEMAIGKPSAFLQTKKAFKTVLEKNKDYQDFQRHDLYNFAIEHQDTLRNVRQDIKTFFKNTKEVKQIDKLLGAPGQLIKMIDNTVKYGYKKLGGLAWEGDKVARTAMALQYKKNGYSTAEAVRKTQLFMAHYDRLQTRTRRDLGLAFYFPSYRVAMLRLYGEMLDVKGTKMYGPLIRMFALKLGEYALWTAVGYKPIKNLFSQISKIGGDEKDNMMDIFLQYRYRKIDEDGKVTIASASTPINELNKYFNRYLDNTLFANMGPLPGFFWSLANNRKFNGSKITDISMFRLVQGMVAGEYSKKDLLKHLSQGTVFAIEQWFPPLADAVDTLGREELTTIEKLINWTGTASIYVLNRDIESVAKDLEKECSKPIKKQSKLTIDKLKFELNKAKRVLKALDLIKMTGIGKGGRKPGFDEALEIIKISNKSTIDSVDEGMIQKFNERYGGF